MVTFYTVSCKDGPFSDKNVQTNLIFNSFLRTKLKTIAFFYLTNKFSKRFGKTIFFFTERTTFHTKFRKNDHDFTERTINYTERLFSEKTNEINDGKWTAILRTNKIIFLTIEKMNDMGFEHTDCKEFKLYFSLYSWFNSNCKSIRILAASFRLHLNKFLLLRPVTQTFKKTKQKTSETYFSSNFFLFGHQR